MSLKVDPASVFPDEVMVKIFSHLETVDLLWRAVTERKPDCTMRLDVRDVKK